MTSESYAGRGRALLEEQHAALVQEIDDLLKDSAAVKQYGYRAENIEVITLPRPEPADQRNRRPAH